ncbi:DUF4145 domain-containing protein [Pseudoteredinibacter isoporae]|uniref:DUF4145 domain-containing protein n=1 Tax=Pseudoteredinibacter isoporae TaxID=570281 RepID=UPI00333ECC5B
MKIIAGFITLLFLGLGFGHLFVDSFEVDVISIVLLILAALPWVFPYLKSLELPGGVKIELKDVQSAIGKITGETELSESNSPQYVDPQLALVALRIDIEKLIRSYQVDIGPKNHSLSIRLQILENEGVLTKEVVNGVLDIIKLGNSAAHGVEVDKDAAEFTLFKSGSIIRQLEAQLKQAKNGN